MYILSSVSLIALIAVSEYWMQVNRVRVGDAQILANYVRALSTVTAKYPLDMKLLQDEIRKDRRRPAPAVYVRVLDASGRTIIETPGMSSELSPDLFPAPRHGRTLEVVGVKPGSSLMKYWLASTWLGNGSTGKQHVLQIALDHSHQDTRIDRYRRRMVFALLVGLLLSSAMAFLITAKSLRPVREIAKRVQEISATSLHRRLGVQEWPSELEVLASTFDEVLDRLQISFGQLSQFSADIAHELRTPLNNLRIEAEVCLSQDRSVQEYRETIESSLEEYERLKVIIDGLLFLARADAQSTVLDKVELAGRKAIEEVLGSYEAALEEQKIEAKLFGTARFQVDPMMFRRAISNLLSNSLQHTYQGGSITLSIEQTDERSAIVRVNDTGCGIDPADLPHVFDRFYMADRSRAENPGNYGLGLPIVKSIMDLHNGSISVDSGVGQGTTVTLIFPA